MSLKVIGLFYVAWQILHTKNHILDNKNRFKYIIYGVNISSGFKNISLINEIKHPVNSSTRWISILWIKQRWCLKISTKIHSSAKAICVACEFLEKFWKQMKILDESWIFMRICLLIQFTGHKIIDLRYTEILSKKWYLERELKT